MVERTWHLEEFERIASCLTSLVGVHSVEVFGSVKNGTHDAFSDLDIEIIADSLLNTSTILNLFKPESILGQERYAGEDSVLFRLLLVNGCSYDIKVLVRPTDPRDRVWVPLPGTDTFWFALHAAHRALVRGRILIALDLTLASYREITQAYWRIDKELQQAVGTELKEMALAMNVHSLGTSILHVATLAGLVFSDSDRAASFIQWHGIPDVPM